MYFEFHNIFLNIRENKQTNKSSTSQSFNLLGFVIFQDLRNQMKWKYVSCIPFYIHFLDTEIYFLLHFLMCNQSD